MIELHEDDPKIFELLLRYLYAGRHDVTAATRAASSQVEGLNTLFELSIMADKYAVRNIEDEIFNYAILCLKAEANDQHEILQKVAEAYCSSVSNSNRYRAKKIVEIALQPPRNLLTSTAFGTIVESQPLFGAEVASALVKTAMTCVSCCTVTIMPKCIGNGEPRLEGHCSNCSRRQSHYRRNYMPPEE